MKTIYLQANLARSRRKVKSMDRTLTLEIMEQTVSYYSEGDEWMDGDYRTIREPSWTTFTYDETDTDWHDGDPVAWAVEHAIMLDLTEASLCPIGDALPEHTWLSGRYSDPYTGHEAETTMRVTGDFTPEERAEIFKGVSYDG